MAEGLKNEWRSRLSGVVRNTVCVRYEEDLVRRLLLVFDEHNHLGKHQLEPRMALAINAMKSSTVLASALITL